MIQIDHIDGRRLRQAVIAGARRVIKMQDHLNRINVFPVADNDTGTNMALTMQSIAEGAISCREMSVSGMSQCLAESAIMGARGNSGAILAQFFQGLADSFNGKLTASIKHFGEAVEYAKIGAYEAITDPKEGTILTVIHDWANHINTHCLKAHDFRDVLRKGLHEAQRSLKETPKKLKLLRKAGVVDAGAQGFVHMLEGILHFLESGTIDKSVGIGGEKTVRRAIVKNAPEDIIFQYCTECLISGNSIDRVNLRENLNPLGDSLIVAGSTQKVRVHIHTDKPESVFAITEKYGKISNKKFDDMRKQHSAAHGEYTANKIALVTDSSCDLNPEFVIRHNLQMVPVQVTFGKDNYIDKITITPKEFYRILLESKHYPKTSQPTPGEFINTYNELWGHYDEAVSIHLSGALSGTLQAAQTAAKSTKDKNLRVIDSSNTSIGLGLIVAHAAKAIEIGCKIDEVVERVEWAVRNVRFYISFETVEYLIRGGRLSKSRGLLTSFLNLKPIVTINAHGKVQTLKKTFGGKAAQKWIMQTVCRETIGKKNLQFAVAHANALETAGWYVEQIKKQFEVKDVMVVNVSPALGAHAGPGAAGVAFLGE